VIAPLPFKGSNKDEVFDEYNPCSITFTNPRLSAEMTTPGNIVDKDIAVIECL
jgi:hypothetical protein